MKSFITGAIKKSRTSLSILVLLGLSGLFALSALPKATEPQVNFPGAYVGVGFEGVSPEDSERLLAKPLEDALRTISGVVDIRSTSATGYAAVVVEFDQDVDIDEALYDVRVKVDEARAELPLDAREPTIREFTSTDNPVLTVSVASSVLPQRVLVNLTQELQDLIETHPNVLEAELNGVPEDLIEAIVDKTKLESYGISMNQLYQAVSNNNRVIPAGFQDTGTGRFAVNVPSVFSSLEDIETLPIKVSGDADNFLDKANKEIERERQVVQKPYVESLYANIHKKRREGRPMRKKGAKGAPKPGDFDRAARTAKEEAPVIGGIKMKKLGKSKPGGYKSLVTRHLGAKAAEKIDKSDGSKLVAKGKKTGNTDLIRKGNFIKNVIGRK